MISDLFFVYINKKDKSSYMTREIIVDVQPKEISIALLEDKKLVELQKEGQEESFSVGNMYIAKVKKLMPGLNACFVNLGHERDAFLHYLDLGTNFLSYQKYLKQALSDRRKLPSISNSPVLPILEKDGSVQNTLKVGWCRSSRNPSPQKGHASRANYLLPEGFLC